MIETIKSLLTFIPLKSKITLKKIIRTVLLCTPIVFVLSRVFFWVTKSADWTVVTNNLGLFIFGNYPDNLIWRPTLWITYLATIFVYTVISNKKIKRTRLLIFLWIAAIPFGFILLSGIGPLEEVSSHFCGGLLLTLKLTICSFLFSLLIGVFLAISRQSNLLMIKRISSAYIDFMRSIPLISVLFFGQLLTPLFLPYGLEINRILRAIIAFTLFLSAYIAEDIRGGLRSIPSTQEEAGRALGLSEWQIIKVVLLPQALKVALPSLTNQAVGLVQNTSLMAILGLIELLGISRSLLANPEYIGRYLEVYLWIALVYWVICSSISILASSIEKKFNLNQT